MDAAAASTKKDGRNRMLASRKLARPLPEASPHAEFRCLMLDTPRPNLALEGQRGRECRGQTLEWHGCRPDKLA